MYFVWLEIITFNFVSSYVTPFLFLDCESKKEEKIENGSETERNAE
jgi:hypothetical protein